MRRILFFFRRYAPYIGRRDAIVFALYAVARPVWTWPLRRLADYLIPGWLDDGSPEGWRFRLICRAWGEDDRAVMPESWEEE